MSRHGDASAANSDLIDRERDVDIRLTVNQAAADYIRRCLFPSDNGKLVVVIVPEVDPEPSRESEVARLGDQISVEALIKRGREYFDSLPSIVTLRWTVAAAERSRFPQSDIHFVSEVPFYLPEETNAVIGERELILDGEVLRFRPELAPFEVNRSRGA